MKQGSVVAGVFVGVWLTASAASAQTLTVIYPGQATDSAPLRGGQDNSKANDHNIHVPQPLPGLGNGLNTPSQASKDDVVQSTAGPLTNANSGTHFAGIGADGYAPPDTNMAVGPNDILQTVNSQYAIYTKTGNLRVGPFSLSSLWANLGPTNGCATNNSGDVIAQYDKLADRFIVTQLGSLSSPYSECIAVSKTNDPAGAYYLYSYSYYSTLNDYQKFGVWPTTTNSAYLSTANLFTFGRYFQGSQLCAYDRTKMLKGDPTAAAICYTISNDGGYLPADLDGPTAPQDGTPGLFVNFETLSSLRMYALAPNFSNPSASKLTWMGDLGVASFSEACGGGTCIPQLGTSQKLDSIGDRLMYRLAYRNFGDHESIVVNHSVTAGSSVGVRWYELQRQPAATSGPFTVFQQGTYAPDATYRWMGSAAMDASGDIAIGYSASSASLNPGIRWAGRTPADASGTLESEVIMFTGNGSQTGSLSRWGDYSALRIDPSDDCTFWYTNEYEPSYGSFNWKTFFGSFKFTGCGQPPAPDFSLSVQPGSQTVATGGTTSAYTITVTPSNGFSDSVNLNATGLPAGATANFNTNPATTSSSLTVMTTANTPAGIYPFTITATDTMSTLSHRITATLVVTDYALSVSPTNQTVNPGNTTSFTVSISRLQGFSEGINVTVDGLPTGASPTYTPLNPATGISSIITITTTSSVQLGSYPLNITGTSATSGLMRMIPATLVVSSAPPPDFSLSATPSSHTVTPGVGTSYTVNITPQGGFAGAVTFSVISGLPSGASAAFSPNPAIGSSTLNITTSSTTPGGSYTLTILGISGTLSHQSTVTLMVSDFSLSATPSSRTVNPGGTTTYTVNIARLGGFSGAVSFTVSGLPFGAGASFSPNPSSDASSTLTVTTTSFPITGTSTLTITGTSGSLTHNTSVTLVVVNPTVGDFALSATPTSRTMTQGTGRTYTIYITPSGGFTGGVTFSISGVPSGVTASFSPNPATGSSALLTITASSTAATGSFTLTITGTSGTLSHNLPIGLVVSVP